MSSAAQRQRRLWSLVSRPDIEFELETERLPRQDQQALVNMLDTAIHNERIRVDGLQGQPNTMSNELGERQAKLDGLIARHRALVNKLEQGYWSSSQSDSSAEPPRNKQPQIHVQKSPTSTKSPIYCRIAENSPPAPHIQSISLTTSTAAPRRSILKPSPPTQQVTSTAVLRPEQRRQPTESQRTSNFPENQPSNSFERNRISAAPNFNSVKHLEQTSNSLPATPQHSGHQHETTRRFQQQQSESQVSSSWSRHSLQESTSADRVTYVARHDDDDAGVQKSYSTSDVQTSRSTSAVNRQALYAGQDRLLSKLRGPVNYSIYKSAYIPVHRQRHSAATQRRDHVTDWRQRLANQHSERSMATIDQQVVSTTKTTYHQVEWLSNKMEGAGLDSQPAAAVNGADSDNQDLDSYRVARNGSLQTPIYVDDKPDCCLPGHNLGKTAPSPQSALLLPAAQKQQMNVAPPNDQPIQTEVGRFGDTSNEHQHYRQWDPTPLIQYLHTLEPATQSNCVDYAPRAETKQNPIPSMEGHLHHLPIGQKVAFAEKQWKERYFAIHDAHLHWYGTSYADSAHSLGDVLLAGADIDLNRDECTFTINSKQQRTIITVRCASHLLEKWRQALMAHAAVSLVDSYLQPTQPAIPAREGVVLIELGSAAIRAGLLTREPSLPQLFFPNLATVLPDGTPVIGHGCLAPEVRHSGTVVRPLLPTQPGNDKYSINQQLIKHILHHIFTQLNVNPVQYKVMLTVPENLPVALVAPLLEYMLCSLGVHSVSVSRQPSLVLYAYDVTTGVVIDCGDRCNIVPIVDGYVVENAMVSLPLGAGQMRDALRAQLAEQKMALYQFQSPVEQFILRHIMESECFISTDYEAETSGCQHSPGEYKKTVSLQQFYPTQQMQSEYTLDSARFTSTEGVYKPSRYGLDVQGVHKLVFGAIQTAPMDSRRALYKNIYLSGGATLLPGFADRLEKELQKLVASSITVQVHMSPWRYHASYLGAQVVAASKQFHESAVTAETLDAFVAQLQAANF